MTPPIVPTEDSPADPTDDSLADLPDGLTTAQVAAYLGVKPETVYAYVSRGVLTPTRRRGRGGSRFSVDDVRALVGAGGATPRRRRAAGVSEDVTTRITLIEDDTVSYRGHDVVDLSRTRTFAQVCSLLWERAPRGATLAPSERAALAALVAALAPGTPPLDRLKHAVLLAAAGDPGRHDATPQSVVDAGARALMHMAASLPGADLQAADPVGVLHGHLSATGSLPRADLEAAMVLLADHDLAVSTTALRVAVSVRADSYSCLLSALAAADSPAHVAGPHAAHSWLAGALADPQAALSHALHQPRPPPGFGHAVYVEVDPRAEELLQRVLPRCDPGVVEAITRLRTELRDRRGWLTSVDLALGLLTLTSGLAPQAGPVVFACARVAGWTAHAVEERAEAALRFRLRGVYSGPRPSG